MVGRRFFGVSVTLVCGLIGVLVIFALLGRVPELSLGSAFGATSNWPTFQHDAGRGGVDSSQPSFTPPVVQWTTPVDAAVYAQPLFTNNEVLVASQNNTVYALDSTSGAVDLATAPVNLSVNGSYYAVSILDSSGNPVVTFDEPLTLMFGPPFGVDPSAFSVSIVDPLTGDQTQLELQFNADGTAWAALLGLSPPTMP